MTNHLSSAHAYKAINANGLATPLNLGRDACLVMNLQFEILQKHAPNGARIRRTRRNESRKEKPTTSSNQPDLACSDVVETISIRTAPTVCDLHQHSVGISGNYLRFRPSSAHCIMPLIQQVRVA